VGLQKQKIHVKAFFLMKICRKRVQTLSSLEEKQIAAFLATNTSTIFHEPAFNSAVSEVFGTDFSYILVNGGDGRLIALCPLHSIKSGVSTMTYSNPAMYGVPYGGWVFNRNEVSVVDLLQQIRLSYNEALTYWSIPQVDNNCYAEVQNKKCYQTSIINLKKDKDFIWHNVIGSKRRNMIRKAEKNKIAVEKVDHKGFADFYRLMKETYRYAGLEIKPEECYTRILDTYIPSTKAIILLARMQSLAASGLVLLRNQHFCHYWLGASNRKIGNLGQGELLQWEAIKWAKNYGSMYYDLCVVEQERLPRIAMFKLGFSRNTVPFYCITRRTLAYRILSRIRKVFR